MTFRFHHYAFRTEDVQALADFYCAMFGMEVVRTALPRSLWLGLSGEAVLMIEQRESGETAPTAGSMEVLALGVAEETKAEVRRRALARDCYDGQTDFTVYLRDPDGRRLGVSTYDLASPAQAIPKKTPKNT